MGINCDYLRLWSLRDLMINDPNGELTLKNSEIIEAYLNAMYCVLMWLQYTVHLHTCNIFTTCVYLFISMLAVDQLIHTFFIYFSLISHPKQPIPLIHPFTNYMLGTKQSLMQTSHFLIETNMLTSFFDKKTSESNVILSLYNFLF
ncbi:hypothetical protein ACJX0J_008997 [Zea mays]